MVLPALRSLCWLLALVSGPALAVVDPATGRWTPGIGDPTVMGWLTVLAYLGAGGLALVNLQAARRTRLAWHYWAALAALMALLALNKQLDLQTWFTQFGRDLALSQGWYDNRRVVQVAFILLLAGAAAGVSVLLWQQLRQSWRGYRLSAVGVAVLMTFIVIRAATFHHIDILLGWGLAGVNLNHLLELGAIGLIAAGAWQWRKFHRKTVRDFFLRHIGVMR
ncbi:hypothetical protein [Caldimonas caldifontis]|uniref:Isopropylmalate isomerase n=1 Tax=Caldimonas caldifontis TaxID=1452508 RepID=A0A2S5SQP5_9BURK|nr:hypothetical protein [Caldimonas caldifontis]PPE65050.1 hypothetical protein C1704_16350 [Caldimonas caldifontis]